MKQIILASASPRRTELLKQIGLNFEVVPSNISEDIAETNAPADYAMNLSCRKAQDVAARSKNDCIIIGADTIVVSERILGKPKDEKDAFEMLKMLRGKWHSVITGLTVIDTLERKTVKCHECTNVKIKNLSDDFIWSYIRTGEPFDKAGSYGIQGIGAVMVEKIEGCYFNVVGLPLARLTSILEEFGVKVL